MNNRTPTPRTDAEIEDWANGLRDMADTHLCCRDTVLDTIELLNQLKRERDQLRKVCDWFATSVVNRNLYGDKPAIAHYNSLPHVIERNAK